MKPGPKASEGLPLLGRVGAGLSLALGAFSVWGWGAGVADVMTFGSNPPVAPAMAWAMFWLGLATWLQHRWTGRTKARRAGRWLAGLTLAIGLPSVVRSALKWDSPLEVRVFGVFDATGHPEAGLMAASTGVAVVVAGLALLVYLSSGVGRPVRPRWHWVFGGSVMAVGLLQVGRTLLGSESLAVSPSIAGSLALVTIGVAIVGLPSATAAGNRPPVARLDWVPSATAGALALVIGVLTGAYLRREQRETRADARELLMAVGRLKESQIVQWLHERSSDARFFSRADFVARDVAAFLREPGSVRARAGLVRWLELLKGGDRYALVALYDTNAALRLALPGTAAAEASVVPAVFDDALRSNRIVMSDLYRPPDGGRPRMDVVFPVSVFEPSPEGIDRPTAMHSGAILLRLDPDQFLFPQVQSWPTPSRTAESILFRRDGDEVLCLSRLRYEDREPMTLRFRVDADSELPPIQALLRGPGAYEGMDYRGVAVLSEIRAVAGTDWFMWAKVDRSEIHGPLIKHAWMTLALTGVLMAGARMATSTLFRHQLAEQAIRELAAERQRRALSERVEHLMKHAGDAIVLADGEYRVLEANDRALALYGYTLDEFKRARLSEFGVPGGPEAFSRSDDPGGTDLPVTFETLHRRKDGSVFPVEVSCRVVETDGSRLRLAIVRDRTQSRAHEREIDRLNRLYATLSEVNQSVIRVKSRAELFDEVCRITVGYGRFALVGIALRESEAQPVRFVARAGGGAMLLDAIAPSDSVDDGGHGLVQRCLRDERMIVVDDPGAGDRGGSWEAMVRARGVEAVAAMPIRFAGRTCGALVVGSSESGVFRDKEAALLEEVALDLSFALDHLDRVECLRTSEEQFRAMFELASVGMAQADPATGRILRANRRFSTITGYGVEELLGLRVSDITHPDDRERDREAFGQVVRGEIPEYHLEKRYVRKDGTTTWVSVNVTVVRDAEGRPLRTMAIIEDIAERKRLEELLRQSQKMEAIGQLAGGVAHDFNNILAASLMQLGLLKFRDDLDAEVKEAHAELVSHAERAAALTRQLLLFSRRSVLHRQPLDLGRVVDQHLKMLRRIIGEQVELERRGPRSLPCVAGDAGMLEQVVMNLVVNARDSMAKGGCIVVDLEPVEVSPDEARANPEARPGSFVRLSVIDDGCGMDEAVLGRIFEPFFTTKPAGRGTGLGLATVYGIVRQHQGWVTVDSAVGRGSTFRVFLPVEGEATQEPATVGTALPAAGHETILLVEDDVAFRRAAGRLLQRYCYRVIEAADGPEAVRLWPQHRDQVALLLTDMIMPNGMNGLELAERLRADKPGLRVLVASGYSADLLHAGDLEARGIRFLPKPCTMEALVETVRRVLDDSPGPDAAAGGAV